MSAKMTAGDFIPLLKDTYTAWNEDRAPRLGAALSYYTVFSLAPLLIVAIGIAGLVFGEEAAQGAVKEQIKGFIGAGAAEMVQGMIQNASKGGDGRSVVATIVGFATILLGAGGLFGQLQDSLNTIWGVQPKPNLGIMFMMRQRFVSFAMVLGVGFVLIVSLAASALTAAFAGWLNQFLGLNEWFLQFLNFAIGFLLLTVVFAAMYKVLPDAEIQWRDVWIGGAVTSLLFAIGKFALGLYLGRSGTESAFGAAGSLVVILLWVYYASQILFFGAEFTKAYANKFGSRIVPSPHADAVSPEMRANQGMAPISSVASAAPTPTNSIVVNATPVETQTTPIPKVGARQKQDFEHALFVVGGAILALLWFARRRDN